MKTLAQTLLCLSSFITFAQAGDVLSIIEITPFTPRQAAPQPDTWWAETAGYYGFAARDLFGSSYPADVGHVDMYSGDITIGKEIIPQCFSLDLRLGYGYGSNKKAHGFVGLNDMVYDEAIKLHRFYLMPGIRWTHDLGHHCTFFAGGNMGVDNASIKSDARGMGQSIHSHNSEWGFAGSLEVGMQYHWTECMYSFLSYQLQGSTSNPTLHADGRSMGTRKQMYHMVRLGVGWDF